MQRLRTSLLPKVTLFSGSLSSTVVNTQENHVGLYPVNQTVIFKACKTGKTPYMLLAIVNASDCTYRGKQIFLQDFSDGSCYPCRLI